MFGGKELDTDPQYMFAYRFTEPMLGVKQYCGTWIIYPAGRDGTRSKMDMLLTWQPESDESNEVFESGLHRFAPKWVSW